MTTGEFRALDAGHWVTLEDDQHVFIRGGRLYASMDAISEAAKQHSVKAGTKLGDAVLAKAAAEKIHPDHLRAAVDAVHQQHRDQEGERLAALSDARQQTGLNAGRIAAWERSGKDYSSYPGLDAKARELAAEHPVLGLHAYSAEAVEEGDNAAQLWEMLSHGAERILPRHDPEILDRAADLVHQGRRGQPLRSKPVRSSAHADDVPFSAPPPSFGTLLWAWLAAGKPERFDLVRFAAAGRTPPVRAILQACHDIAASHLGVCGIAPSAAEFARPSRVSRSLRAIHDLTAAGEAVCRTRPPGR